MRLGRSVWVSFCETGRCNLGEPSVREGEGQARGSSGSVSALGLGGAVSGLLCEIGGLGDRSGSLGCYRGELWGPFGSLGLGEGSGAFL